MGESTPQSTSDCYQRHASVQAARCIPKPSDDSQRAPFDHWGHRKSHDIKEAAQLLLNDSAFDEPKRLLLNLSADDSQGFKVESFDVVSTKELIDTVGTGAAIIEKNFSSSTARRLADRTLVPVYTVCDGVLRIIPKLLETPQINNNKASLEEQTCLENGLDGVKERISKIVNAMNEAKLHKKRPSYVLKAFRTILLHQKGNSQLAIPLVVGLLFFLILISWVLSHRSI